MRRHVVLAACAALSWSVAHAAEPVAPAAESPSYDAGLAASVGADERGMRSYVLVILKTGPTRVPDGPERDAMFRGHFANMQRLSEEGKLAYAGPLDGVDGRRGLFILATGDLEEARQLVATDPVIIEGEMVAEYHKHYGSAALMLVRDAHKRIARTPL
jgi:uncharacterized protein YciI